MADITGVDPSAYVERDEHGECIDLGGRAFRAAVLARMNEDKEEE